MKGDLSKSMFNSSHAGSGNFASFTKTKPSVWWRINFCYCLAKYEEEALKRIGRFSTRTNNDFPLGSHLGARADAREADETRGEHLRRWRGDSSHETRPNQARNNDNNSSEWEEGGNVEMRGEVCCFWARNNTSNNGGWLRASQECHRLAPASASKSQDKTATSVCHCLAQVSQQHRLHKHRLSHSHSAKAFILFIQLFLSNLKFVNWTRVLTQDHTLNSPLLPSFLS